MMFNWLNNPIFYETNHPLSQQMAMYFNMGFKYPVKNVKYYDENSDAVMYGILRGCSEIMCISKNNNRNYVNVDHGYFTDRNLNPYYRITKNSRYYSSKLLDLPDDRFKMHNLTIKEYKQPGNDIIILPPSSFWGQYSNIDYAAWPIVVVDELKKLTDRNIIIKQKTDTKPLSEYLKSAYVVIHYSSIGAIEALLEGIPVITLGPSTLNQYSSTVLTDIDNIKFFDREKLFYNLAYHQYNVQEIISGTAKNILNDLYKEIEK